jgi:hypothetical protein
MKYSSSSDAFSAIETFAAEIGHFSEFLSMEPVQPKKVAMF